MEQVRHFGSFVLAGDPRRRALKVGGGQTPVVETAHFVESDHPIGRLPGGPGRPIGADEDGRIVRE